MIFSAGSGTPMMPVEEGKISAAGTPNNLPGFATNTLAGLNAGASGGAVGVAGVHDRRRERGRRREQ